MTSNNPVLLITSAAAKAPLIEAARNALGRVMSKGRLIAGDVSQQVVSRYMADCFWQMPPTTDEHLDEIIRNCHSHQVNIILPTRDGELLFWARHKSTFEEQGITVLVSPEESIRLCLDKLAFASFGHKNNLPIIPASTLTDKIHSSRIVTKERHSSGSKKIGLDMTPELAAAFSENLEHPIFQPYIKGKEISIDAWLSKSHQLKGLILRYRDLISRGEAQVTTTFREPKLERQMEKIFVELKLSGPVMLQAILDETGSPHIVECNPRFGGASTASIAAGLDSLYWSILEGCGHETATLKFQRSTTEIRQIRITKDIYVNATDL